jgi:predicted  nucleic acid-binding Zn-ribbon protein
MTPAAVAGHLGRLREQYDQAVVRVEGRSCAGCGGQMPQQQAIDAARGKALVRCPSCARFVVRMSYS